jgi:hypothetical protein
VVKLLLRWSGVTLTDELRIPDNVTSDVLDFWAVDELGESLGAMKDEIGLRGELYTYQFERERAADPTKIVWPAREDDTLGYDISDLDASPRRLIEVKASGSEDLRFYLSRHELYVAEQKRNQYEVQFWGGVDLSRSKPVEYRLLREKGFPISISDVYGEIQVGRLTAEAANFVVTRSRG